MNNSYFGGVIMRYCFRYYFNIGLIFWNWIVVYVIGKLFFLFVGNVSSYLVLRNWIYIEMMFEVIFYNCVFKVIVVYLIVLWYK